LAVKSLALCSHAPNPVTSASCISRHRPCSRGAPTIVEVLHALLVPLLHLEAPQHGGCDAALLILVVICKAHPKHTHTHARTRFSIEGFRALSFKKVRSCAEGPRRGARWERACMEHRSLPLPHTSCSHHCQGAC